MLAMRENRPPVPAWDYRWQHYPGERVKGGTAESGRGRGGGVSWLGTTGGNTTSVRAGGGVGGTAVLGSGERRGQW